MTTKVTTIPSMAKSEYIQIRVSPRVKQSIEAAAAKQGRTITNYLIWLAVQHDKGVREAVLND